MAFIYRPSEEIGKIRLLITDTVSDNEIFSDEEISTFLNMTGSDIYLASALALETIARSEALVQKKIKLLDLTTDGPALAAELRASAKLLREESENESYIDWAELALTNANRREIIINDALRNE